MIDLDLAEVARERHAYAEAEGRYTRALELLPASDDRRRLLALRGRADVRYRVGRAADSIADFEAARKAAKRVGEVELELELLLAQATAHDWGNDAPASARLVGAAQALSDATGVKPRSLRAGLLVGLGRTSFRAGRFAEACALLEQGVDASEQLGAAGYEPLVIALTLLEVVLPNLGRSAEAELVANRVVALTRARGDQLHLASALNNRRNLLVARKDVEGAIADQRAFAEIGRQLGLELAEYYAEFNIAELNYQAGNLDAAASHAARAESFEQTNPSVAPRPAAALLRARLLAFQGLMEDARAALAGVRNAVAKARAENREAGLLAPSEEVLLAMVDLSTRPATSAEWDALVALSARDSLEQEPVEVVEMRALTARRQGRQPEAQQAFADALALASRVPNLLEARIRRGQSGALPN